MTPAERLSLYRLAYKEAAMTADEFMAYVDRDRKARRSGAAPGRGMGYSRMDSLADDIRKAREDLAALERPGRTVPADRAKKIKTARKRLDKLLARANESVAARETRGKGACGVKKASGGMSGADMIITLLATGLLGAGLSAALVKKKQRGLAARTGAIAGLGAGATVIAMSLGQSKNRGF